MGLLALQALSEIEGAIPAFLEENKQLITGEDCLPGILAIINRVAGEAKDAARVDGIDLLTGKSLWVQPTLFDMPHTQDIQAA